MNCGLKATIQDRHSVVQADRMCEPDDWGVLSALYKKRKVLLEAIPCVL